MKKRRVYFLVALGLVAALLLIGCSAEPPSELAPAAEEPEQEEEVPPAQEEVEAVEWKLFANVGIGQPPVEDWLKYAAYIEEVTQGRLQIDVFAAGEHAYKADELLGAVSDGVCDMCIVDAPNITGQEPAVGISDLVLLMPSDVQVERNVNHQLYAQDGMLGSMMRDKWGVTAKFMNSIGGQYIWLNEGWLEDDDSFKGKRIRTYSADMDNFVSMLNGTPVRIASEERYQALQTGLIDGYITGITSSYVDKLNEVSKHLVPLSVFSVTNLTLVNNDAYADLPAELRVVFDGVIEDNRDVFEVNAYSQSGLILLRMFELYNLEVKPVPSDYLREIRAKAMDNLWQPWIDRTPNGDALFQQTVSLLEAEGVAFD